MADDEKVNNVPQDDIPETPEERPVFRPEMIIENAMESDINIPEDDLTDYLKKSDKE